MLTVPVAGCTVSSNCFSHRRIRALPRGGAGRSGGAGKTIVEIFQDDIRIP